MKYLTMVARCGEPKTVANLLKYTLIGDDFSVHTMTGDKLSAALNDGKVVVTNMAVSAKGLVSTNGALDKYTLVHPTGGIIGTPRVVILNRVETNGKLTGYIVFHTNGVVAQISVADAAALAGKGLIANGKIRHTAEGDIVSAIGGNYPLLEHIVKSDKPEKPIIDVVFFGSALKAGKLVKFVGANVTCKDAMAMPKILTTLESNNKKLTNKLGADYGYSAEDLKSFEVKPVSGAGFYGVYPMALVQKMMQNGKAKFTGKVFVNCKDAADADAPESIVVYDTKKKAVVSSQEGTEKSDAKLKTYLDEVKKILG